MIVDQRDGAGGTLHRANSGLIFLFILPSICGLARISRTSVGAEKRNRLTGNKSVKKAHVLALTLSHVLIFSFFPVLLMQFSKQQIYYLSISSLVRIRQSLPVTLFRR